MTTRDSLILSKNRNCPSLAVFLLLLLCAFNNTVLWGQRSGIGHPLIQNFDRKSYHANAQTWAIAENDKGFIYGANLAGLIEFDGDSWQTYALPNHAPLRDVQIKQDTLFVAGSNDFGYFVPHSNGELRYRSLVSQLPLEWQVGIGNVWRVHVLANEVLFQSERGLYHWANQKVRFSPAKSEYKFSSKLGEQVIIQDKKYGLQKYENGQLKTLPATRSLNTTEVWSVIPMDSTHWLVCTMDQGILQYDGKQLTEWETPASTFLKDCSCLGGRVLRNGYYVFHTILNGYIITNPNGVIVQHVNKNKGLYNDTVLNSFETQNGTLWFALDNGLSKVNIYNLYDYIENSDDIGSVYDIAVFKNQLVTATNKGVFRTPWKKEEVSQPFAFVPKTNGQAWRLEVLDQELYVMHNRGLYAMDENGNVQQLIHHGVWSLWPTDDTQRQYIANTYKGLYLLTKDEKGRLRHPEIIQGYSESENHFVYTKGRAFLIRNRELIRMRFSPDFKQVQTVAKLQHAEELDEGFDQVFLHANEVIVTVGNRFYEWNFQKLQLEQRNHLTKLFSKYANPHTIKIDKRGSIWFKYGDQLGHIQRHGNGTYTDRSAELRALKGSWVPIQLGIHSLDKQRTLVGVNNGLLDFDFSQAPTKPEWPKPLIRSITYGNTTLNWNRERVQTKRISIPNMTYPLQFRFASPNGDDVEYAYRILGVDENWSEWSYTNQQLLTKLDPGSYSLEVKVRNHLGESPEMAVLHFDIQAPWYRSNLAIIVYLLLGAGLFIVVRKEAKKWIQYKKDVAVQQELKRFLKRQEQIRHQQNQLELELERLRNEKEMH